MRGHGEAPHARHVLHLLALRVSSLGFGVEGLGFGVWGLRFGVWGLGIGVWGLGFRVEGFGFGVWGLGLGVWGLGFRDGWRSQGGTVYVGASSYAHNLRGCARLITSQPRCPQSLDTYPQVRRLITGWTHARHPLSSEYTRQSMPNFGLGFQAKVIRTL